MNSRPLGPAMPPGARRGRDGRPDFEPGRRLFIAVPVPEAISSLVSDLVARIRAEEGEGEAPPPDRGGHVLHRVRWVSLDDLHLTIRFLGPTPDERVDLLRGVVQAAVTDSLPFPVGIGSAGAFPGLERPRALWLSVADPSGGLEKMSASVGRALVDAGWPADDRPYTPHLTLARTDGVRSGPRVARRLLAATHGLETWFEADRLVLYESHTGGGPARYEPLFEALLAG